MNLKIQVYSFPILIIISIFVSCARPSLIDSYEAMRPAKKPSEINDDLPIDQLAAALEQNVAQLNKTKGISLSFGPKIIKKDDYILALQFLADQIENGITKSQFNEMISENFEFFEVYGKEKWGEVFITSYFEPVITGSEEKNPQHSQPLYRVPEDLVNVRLDKFVDKFDRYSLIKDQVLEPKNRLKILRGRLAKSKDNNKPSNIVPYYSRKEIDGDEKLKGKELELAWVDPIDAFFLQIQGSGTVKFNDNNELRLGYSSQNGHSYFAIGKALFDVIPREKMSMQSIDNYLRSLPEPEMNKILYMNPSYIFFRELDTRPVTAFGTEVVDGRTIATDRTYFPKGTLAYLEFSKPVFEDETSIEPLSYLPTSRYVIDQDTGGAIRGPYRVDLFWGRGKESGRYAGVMKNWGRLYYIVPKDDFIKELRSEKN